MLPSYVAHRHQPRFERTLVGDFSQRWIFDLASLTKLIVTAPLIIGKFYLQRKQFAALTLGEVLPPATGEQPLSDRVRALKLLDLLSHRAGLAPWLNFYVNRLAVSPKDDLLASRHQQIPTVLGRVGDAKLFNPHPNKASTYSDIGYILLGLALEQATGKSLAVLFRRWLKDLGLPPGIDIGFNPEPSLCIPTGYCKLRQRQLYGEVHDENCASLGGVAGHAGLFASLPALSVLLPRWFIDHRVQTLVELTATSQDGVGFRRGDDGASTAFGGGAAIGHYGFTGTSLWLTPDSRRYHLLLTNRVIAGRLALSAIKKYRHERYRYSWSKLSE